MKEVDLAAHRRAERRAGAPVADGARDRAALHAAALPLVVGDPVRLGQVIDNLVSNALKFTPAGGRVEVRCGATARRRAHRGRRHRHGHPGRRAGAPLRALLPHRAGADRGVPGAGLGLSIAKAIVEAHGGTISCASVDGEGTTFAIELPLARARRCLTFRRRRTRTPPQRIGLGHDAASDRRRAPRQRARADARAAVVCVNGGQGGEVEGTWSASLEWLVARLAPHFPELAFGEVRYRIKSWKQLDWCVEDARAAIDALGARAHAPARLLDGRRRRGPARPTSPASRRCSAWRRGSPSGSRSTRCAAAGSASSTARSTAGCPASPASRRRARGAVSSARARSASRASTRSSPAPCTASRCARTGDGRCRCRARVRGRGSSRHELRRFQAA